MKKIIAIALLLLYGAASSGMTVQFHYCCGKLDNVSLAVANDTHCGMKHKMGSKSCCATTLLSLKIKAEQQAAKVFQTSFGLVALKTTPPDFFVTAPVVAKRLLPEIFAPPPLAKDFTRLYCTYRI